MKCEMCKEHDSVFVPTCKKEAGKLYTKFVCRKCKDKIPHKVLPFMEVVGEGYFNLPETK